MRTNEVIRNLEITYPRKLADQINQVYKNHCQAWEYKVFDKGKVSGWVPPCPPNVKLNFDAAVGRNEACLAAETVQTDKIIYVWIDFLDCTNLLVAEAERCSSSY